MVRVTISVTSWFKRYTNGLSCLELDLNSETTALEAVCKAGIPYDEIGFITLCSKVKASIEEKVDESYVAADGDFLKVYPLIIGG